jgi:hypothetical protein
VAAGWFEIIALFQIFLVRLELAKLQVITPLDKAYHEAVSLIA